ncbi:uncharacterized protein Z519_02109 [Cladophialophora bantiana CBS 173.52]|uniref:Unplaced genomic scaffold supercont1.3, whole genome shotgun sequence n=1 Tax=Cladophialophora bantiana (strain ATCC 10958 / CBS 173.52 / CDC B-1940 / NIH 8579) TaxID=1442370 RepID=A0A0D2HTD5_CLAB1|nr:uncharacterized protein Z519_02109 [Cladophialophora bantiana CBS 173.52]KIW96718.1 hypothetical protein Z519_02109 [Cladophialophora bantiana CBS 173.52]
MSLPCPYRHVSYATWRLGVIRTLCRSFDEPHLRPSASIRREHTKPQIRNAGDSRSATKNGDGPTAQHGPPPAIPSSREAKKRDSGRGESFNPYSGPGRQAIKELLSDLKKASRKIQLGDEDIESFPFGSHRSLVLDSSGDGDGNIQNCSRQQPLADVQLRKYHSTQEESFVAYNAEGRQAIKDLPTKLQEGRKKIQPRDGTGDNSRLKGESLPTLQSPIIAQVENAARRREERKEHPSYRRIKGLKNNPWAEILASPLRACQGSGARLPQDLLMDFGYVKNQKDGKIYLMPASLADLDALEAKLAAELAIVESRSPQLRDGTEMKRDNQFVTDDGMTEDDDEPDGFPRSSPGAAQKFTNYSATSRKYIPTQSRLLSNLTFLRLLTSKVTRPVKKTSNSPSPTKFETMSGEVGKLIHFDARESTSTAQHYLQNKYRFDSAIDGEDASGNNPLGPDLPSAGRMKGRFNLNRLQWQPDVHLRVADIMRKRIFAAMKALADSESAVKSQALPARPSGVISLPIPQDGMFKGEELRRLMMAMSSTTTPAGLKIRAVAGKPKREPSPNSTPSSTSNAEVDPFTTTHYPPSTAEEAEYHALGHSEWLPGSIFLRIGNDGIISPASSHFSPSSLPPLPLDNPLIPPMITVLDTYRFPVFSLRRLFANAPGPGISDMEELNRLIRQQSIFQPPNEASISSEDEKGDYLLLIRPLPGPAKAVIEEVWRLWRYLGGRNLDLNFASVTEKQSREDKARESPPQEGSAPLIS